MIIIILYNINYVMKYEGMILLLFFYLFKVQMVNIDALVKIQKPNGAKRLQGQIHDLLTLNSNNNA